MPARVRKLDIGQYFLCNVFGIRKRSISVFSADKSPEKNERGGEGKSSKHSFFFFLLFTMFDYLLPTKSRRFIAICARANGHTKYQQPCTDNAVEGSSPRPPGLDRRWRILCQYAIRRSWKFRKRGVKISQRGGFDPRSIPIIRFSDETVALYVFRRETVLPYIFPLRARPRVENYVFIPACRQVYTKNVR